MSKPWSQMTKHEQDGRASAAWKRQVEQVYAIHGDRCWLCGRPGANTVDHIVELDEGGSNDLSNLRPAHGEKHPEWGCPGNFGRSNTKKRAPRLTSRRW